ncbi:MAG TPA: lactate utilization protein [Candidatus Acidoferrum sp.]|nr:lactate utilization protein [Candidatus Acidoferrum sp.]
MTNREIILGRIREALKIAAPHPAFEEDRPSPLPASPQQWLPPVGQALEQQIELFQKNAEDLKAGFRACASLSEAAQHVKSLAAAGGWKKIGRHSGELTDAVVRDLGLPEVLTDHGYAVNDLESCDAGLTGCEALVAQTGSVLVSAPSAGGRALSVLPPHHIVLARRSQVVPDLSVALQRVQEKFKDKFPSFLSFISGPSRTGDIERILVLGAHGPKKLTILLLP